jgi:hypothetical protein
MILAVGAVGCEGFNIQLAPGNNSENNGNNGSGGNDDNGGNNGNGGNDDNNTEVGVSLTRCWRLVTFCDVPAEVDVYINFGKDGKFTIYQRTDELTYTVFNGTYTVDKEQSLISGVYSDGVKWATDYKYEVDAESEELMMESVKNPDEVSIYKPADVPVTKAANMRVASAEDVKPL